MKKKNNFLSVRASSWESARQLADFLVLWHFRGQSDADWNLSTSMERISGNYGNRMYPEITEASLIYEFRRRAHHYLTSPPHDNALLEWLSMLQHYGCPTRLLDFTHSFYISAFFALETALGDAAVWAIDRHALNRSIDAIIGRETTIDMCLNDWNHRNIQLVESYIGNQKRTENMVVDVEPERMNERLSIQQGLFLFPCNATASFMDNLLATFSIKESDYESQIREPLDSECVFDDQIENVSVLKIILPTRCHKTAIHDLKDMNITAASLFPGLEGFARSLSIQWRRVIDQDWHDRRQAFCAPKNRTMV